MPRQIKVVVRSLQEYPGTVTWHDYAVLCPECDQMCEDYGNVSTMIDGYEHFLCITCGNEVCPVAGQPKGFDEWVDLGGEGGGA